MEVGKNIDRSLLIGDKQFQAKKNKHPLVLSSHLHDFCWFSLSSVSVNVIYLEYICIFSCWLYKTPKLYFKLYLKHDTDYSNPTF